VRLDLLVPWALPLDQPLTGREREHVRQALLQLRQALREACAEQALQRLEQGLADLGEIAVQPIAPATTNTPLRVVEVSDYDRYFGLQHVHTPSDARCLVRGLLVACHRFLTLCCQISALNPEYVERQKRGFSSYVSLLARVFYINLTEQDTR
jgi:hypothetical protein